MHLSINELENEKRKSYMYIPSGKLKMKIAQQNSIQFVHFAYCILVLCLLY